MAIDARTHGERAQALKNVISLLNQTVTGSADIQKYYRNRSAGSSGDQFDRMWTDIEARLAVLKSTAQQAESELEDWVSTAQDIFKFRYRWAVGEMNISRLSFITPANTIAVQETIGASGTYVSIAGAFQNLTPTVVLGTGDIIEVRGTGANDGRYTINASTTGSLIYVDETLTTDQDTSGSIELVSWT